MFNKWLVRLWRAGVIWRMEIQQRGVLHYHLLVWGVDPEGESVNGWDTLEKQLSHKWCALTGQGMDEDRLREGLHLKILGNSCKSRFYMVGHSAKKGKQVAYRKGRQWGVYNRKVLNIGEHVRKEPLTSIQYLQFCRLASRHRSSVSKRPGRYDFTKRKEVCIALAGNQLRKALDWVRENFA